MAPTPSRRNAAPVSRRSSQSAFATDQTAFAIGFLAIVLIFAGPLSVMYLGLFDVALWYQAFVTAFALFVLVRLGLTRINTENTQSDD